jgi:hypothetical protein
VKATREQDQLFRGRLLEQGLQLRRIARSSFHDVPEVRFEAQGADLDRDLVQLLVARDRRPSRALHPTMDELTAG